MPALSVLNSSSTPISTIDSASDSSHNVSRKVGSLRAAAVFDSDSSYRARTSALSELLPPPDALAGLRQKEYMQTIKTGWPSDENISFEALDDRFEAMCGHSVLGLAEDGRGRVVSTVSGVVDPLPDGGVRIIFENLTTRADSQQQGFAKKAIDDLVGKIERLPIKYAGGTSLQPHANAFYQRCGLEPAGIEYGKEIVAGEPKGLLALLPAPWPFVVRDAEVADLDKGFEKLLGFGFHPEKIGPITPQIFQAYLERCGTFKRVFVIEDTDKQHLVATAAYFNEIKLTEGGGRPTGRLSGLAADPDYQQARPLDLIFQAIESEAKKHNARCLLAHGTADDKSMFAQWGMTDRTLELGVSISTDAQTYFRQHRDRLSARTWKMSLFFQALGIYHSLLWAKGQFDQLFMRT